jgi:hypothetical protein
MSGCAVSRRAPNGRQPRTGQRRNGGAPVGEVTPLRNQRQSVTIATEAMTFKLADVVPWGRSFAEHVAMFGLSDADLRGRILGCGDGPASFNAEATERQHRVTSVDPLYQYTAEQIRRRVEDTAPTISAELRRNAREFVWTQFRSVDELIAARLAAMEIFVRDLASEPSGRYVAAALPSLPFRTREFDLALCSHFLFLYSEQHDLDFHVASIRELARVAQEVRIFPLLELGSVVSRHLKDTAQALMREGYSVERVAVDYELQKGGNEMLRVARS